MAYNKTFNPDALPAHAEPDQAAAALSRLDIRDHPPQQQKPLPRPQQQQQHSQHSQHYPPRDDSYRRQSPHPQQQDHRPPPPQDYRPPPQQDYRPPPQQDYRAPLQTDHRYNTGYGQQADNRWAQSPPPPTDYGRGQRPPPPSAGYGPPPPQQPSSRPYAPSDLDGGDLYPLFRAANVSNTGSLTTTELGSALVNADFTPFDPLTIRSLMRMFSSVPPSHPQQVIVFTEFENLWKFLAAWRQLFERFDEDGSGKITLREFSNAMTAFGYRLSQPFISLLYTTYNDRGAGDRRTSYPDGMSFDLFVQACLTLKRMTDVFKEYDDDRDGYVTLSFEEFLSEILKLRET